MESPNVMKAKVSTRGWIVIPAALHKRHGLKSGALVEFREVGGRIVIIPRVTDVIEDLYGKLAGETSLTKALLEDRAKELGRCLCCRPGSGIERYHYDR